MAFAAACALGVLSEVWQHFASRDAEVQDVVRDVLGAAAFLLVARAADRDANTRHRVGRARRVIACVLAAGLMAGALARAGTVALAYLRRDASFPAICRLDASWERVFVSVRDGDLAVTPPPAGWDARGRSRVGRVTLLPRACPTLVIREPHPDWTGFARLAFDVYSAAEAPVELVIRIDDARHDNTATDRFNRVLPIQPGVNRVSIPLAEVRDAPRGRKMDLSRVRNLMLFAVGPKAPLTVYLDELRLERE